MDTLETFQMEIQRMIDKYSLNVNISGVAELVTKEKQHIYSASMIVNGEGTIRYPSEEGVAVVMATLERFSCDGFKLKTLQFLRALYQDQKLLRWQVQYVVEDASLPVKA